MVAEPLSKQTGERAYHNWRERCIEFCQLWVSRCYVLAHFFYLILFFVYSPFTFVLACQGIGETTGLLEISVTDAFFSGYISYIERPLPKICKNIFDSLLFSAPIRLWVVFLTD